LVVFLTDFFFEAPPSCWTAHEVQGITSFV
jgi:hypothetical protein